MNPLPKKSAQMPNDLKARKLHLNGIIVGMNRMKNPNARENKYDEDETLTIGAIKTELDFKDF